MDIITCPTTGQIGQMLRGEIAEPLATELLQHISGCTRCSRALRRIKSESSELLPRVVEVRVDSAGDDSLSAAKDAPASILDFLSPPIESDEIGRLAHYRIFKVLGEGGMGVVLHGEDTLLERPVALKIIKPEFGSQPETRQRFVREARAMAQVKSDHVVTVYQVGQENDTYFIAMELLDGESLDSLIDREGRLSLSETLRVGREITQALAAAHSTGLIHRDIKPANVWLESTGRVKLLDFGLARPQAVDFHLTHTGMVMGTPAYMAPEQARAEPLDSRADLFSLGCLLYRMSSGRPAFSGDTLMALMMALAQDTPPPPSYHNIQLPDALDQLVMHLLQKEPNDRPESAHSVIARLQEIEAKVPATNKHSGGVSAVNPVDPPPSIYRPKPSILGHSTVPSKALSSQSVFITREAEHRQVTVLVCSCDLFESEDYLERFDANEQIDLRTTFQSLCEQAICELDGTVVQKTDDSVIACFGYPIAHEDAAARAARSSLSILKALKPLNDTVRKAHKVELGTWLVLNTGPAIVEKKNEDVSVVGEARNVAMRLKAVVGAGQIVCTEATQKLLYGNFEYSELGDHKIKNLAQPVALFQIESVIEVANPIKTADPTQLSPLTGRDHELSLLKARWEQSNEGMGQVVHLVGEAGLGKSRLAHELKHYVLQAMVEGTSQRAYDPILVEWHSSPHSQNTALYPVRSFFQRLLRFGRDEDPLIHRARLIEHLDKFGLAMPDTVPLFTSLLGLTPDPRFPSLALTPVKEREETFRALKDWLCAYCNEHPLLLLVEDLHWLDSSTLEFLEQFLVEATHNAFFIILTSRPEFQPPWAVLSHLTSIALSHLTKAQVSEFLRKKTGMELSRAVIEMIYDRAGGVPLFIEEFTHMAAESGALEKSELDSSQLKTTLMGAIPATLQDMIMARLERMDGDRELAQFAATLGREFSYELIAAAAGAEEPVLNIELTKLVQAEVLYEKGRRPRSTFIFKNLLLQDALYNTLIKSKRQQFHAIIVECIEGHFPQMVQTQPELLAFHSAEGGLIEKAVTYWLTAGLRSQELFSNTEAIGHFKRGLELLTELEESTMRDMLELSLLTPLGSSYQVVLGYSAAEVHPTFERAGQLCRQIGDQSRLFAVMWGNWTWNLVRAELNLCLELTDEMLSVAASTNDRGMLMEAFVARAVTLFYRGDFSGCRKLCEQSIERYEDPDQCRSWCGITGQNAAVVVRCYLALALWHMGSADYARQLNKEMLLLARQIGHPFSLAHGLYFSGRLMYHCRLASELKQAADEEVALAFEQGFALWQATGVFQQATAMFLENKESAEVLQQLEQGLLNFRSLSGRLTVPAQLCILSTAYMKTGLLKKASDALAEATELAKHNHDLAQEPDLLRLKGELAILEGGAANEALAQKYFKQAIESAQRQSSRSFELRATISLAKLMSKQGRREEARESLATIYGTFTQGLNLPELVAAKELLEQLSQAELEPR